jgi:hypothetical protein
MNLKGIHYFLLGLGMLSMLSQAVATNMPQYAPLCHAVASCAGTMAATLGVLCPSAAADPAMPVAAQPAAPLPAAKSQ